MKKALPFVFVALVAFGSPSFAAWDASEPAGTTNISDIDTVVQANNEALEDALEDMRGWANLAVTYTSATSVTVTADQLWLQQSGDLPRNFSSVSEVVDITASGASGLDTGSEAGDTWYYIWVIAKADNTINGLLSASASSPTLPAGYVYKTLVSAVRNDGSSNFINFKQADKTYTYPAWRSMASGNVGATPWVAVDTTAFVPSSLSTYAFGSIVNISTAATNDSTVADSNPPARNKYLNDASGGQMQHRWEFDILTANTLWWWGATANSNFYIHGFVITKL